MSLQTPPGSEIRRGNCVAMPRRRGGMDVAHVTTRRMPAVKPVGKPDAGNPHVRFDERGGETDRSRGTAPLLDSTVSENSQVKSCGPCQAAWRQRSYFARAACVFVRPRKNLPGSSQSLRALRGSVR